VKRSDIATDTVYVCGEGNADYSDRYAAVIIDTRDWTMIRESHDYSPYLGVRLANTAFGREGLGMLAIRQGRRGGHFTVPSEFKPEELLRIAAEARDTLMAGALPTLDGYDVAIIRPQGVRGEWTEYATAYAEKRAQRSVAARAAAERHKANIAAANRVNWALGRETNDFGHVTMPNDAVELEEMLEAYRQKMLDIDAY
jgi:hypothetical protein